MKKLADFLTPYHTVIFDLDGVITSEQEYWNAAALTVWEALHSAQYFGIRKIDPVWAMEHKEAIRREIFADDRVISILKEKGVNSNWDLTYVVFTLWLIQRTPENVLGASKRLAHNILDEYGRLQRNMERVLTGQDGSRNGAVWQRLRSCFQEWYLGEEAFRELYERNPELPGKGGLCKEETPLIPGEVLRELMAQLSAAKKRLCIGTGRPLRELKEPLENFGILQYFEADAIVSYDDVWQAEEKYSENLTKPHPFVFQKAYRGTKVPEEMLTQERQEAEEGVLVVGDAGADLLAAQAAGMDFCAVLTGVSGKKAKGYFKKNGANYIVNSLENFLE